MTDEKPLLPASGAPMSDQLDVDALADFLRPLVVIPAALESIRAFPPGAKVRAKPGRVFLIPAPGVDGTIYSYFEDGDLGVAAPVTIPHPSAGGEARRSASWRRPSSHPTTWC
jgi:hypothetical protein